MPLIDLGAGATTSNTTRSTSASDDLVATAVGTPGDAAALDPISTASVVALLKGQVIAFQTALQPLLDALVRIETLLANQR